MPIATEPMDRYDRPRIVATASPALANCNSLVRTSSGMVVSVASWTSRP